MSENDTLAGDATDWLKEYCTGYTPKKDLLDAWTTHAVQVKAMVIAACPTARQAAKHLLGVAFMYLTWLEAAEGVGGAREGFTHPLVERFIKDYPRGWTNSSAEVNLGKLRALVRAAQGDDPQMPRRGRSAPEPYRSSALALLREAAEHEPALADALDRTAEGTLVRPDDDAGWKRAKAAARSVGVALDGRRLRVNSLEVRLATSQPFLALLEAGDLSRNDLDNLASHLLRDPDRPLTRSELSSLR